MLRTDETSGRVSCDDVGHVLLRSAGVPRGDKSEAGFEQRGGQQVGARFLCGGGVTADAHRWATSATI
jgi:hypothetical protein